MFAVMIFEVCAWEVTVVCHSVYLASWPCLNTFHQYLVRGNPRLHLSPHIWGFTIRTFTDFLPNPSSPHPKHSQSIGKWFHLSSQMDDTGIIALLCLLFLMWIKPTFTDDWCKFGRHLSPCSVDSTRRGVKNQLKSHLIQRSGKHEDGAGGGRHILYLTGHSAGVWTPPPPPDTTMDRLEDFRGGRSLPILHSVSLPRWSDSLYRIRLIMVCRPCPVPLTYLFIFV